MFKNYIKVAIRNFRKNKLFSFINILGLAIGLTCCMLISLYIYNELSYDSYHKNADQVYQLGTTFIRQGQNENTGDNTPNTPSPMAATMQMEFPEIELSARLLKAFADDKTLLQYTPSNKEKKSFYETDAYLADSTFFKIFTYNFKEGNPATALEHPNCVVLSDAIAKKMFGNEPALNKVIHISSNTNGDHDFKITGVYAASKIPSHINARLIMSLNGGDMENYVRRTSGNLVNNNMFYTYFKLKNGTDPHKLEAKFPAFIDKYAGKDLKAAGFYKHQFLTALKDIHLFSRAKDKVSPGGSVTYLYILGSIALFTLLIACINFMNLSTARSSKRSAEVGVRKVLGAEKRSLILQFLGESLIMSLAAFVIAVVVSDLLLSSFSSLAGKDISFSFAQHGLLFVAFFLLAIITGLLAGSYPAFYLSSFKPVKVLKGRSSNSLAAVSLRKILVVFQFVISVVLIIASVIIVKQMNYMRNEDLGFASDQQVIIPLRSNVAKGVYTSLKAEIEKNSAVKSVGAAEYYPGIMHPSDMLLYKDGLTTNESKRVFMNYVDEDFLGTLGIKLLAGRMFNKEFAGDTLARVVLNETAIKEMGYASPQAAVGTNAKFDWQGRTNPIEVLGVVKDFHFKDLHVAIEPYGFQLNTGGTYNYLFAHTVAGNVGTTLRSIEAAWHKLNPNEPFEYSFLDNDFQKNYEAGNRLSSIVQYFTIIAILISCLGLFGLSLFSTEQRTKEIGIRKVLGASAGNIVTLLSKDFVKLVCIAIIIASPLAWYAMNKWLQDFAYRINISWTVFLVTALIAICIALFTVSFQAIKAAIANPVKSLRTE